MKVSPLQGHGFHCLISQELSLRGKITVLLGEDLPLITVFSEFLYSSGFGCSVSSFALGYCLTWPVGDQFVASVCAEQTCAFFLSVSQLQQPSSAHLPHHLPTLCWEDASGESNKYLFCFFGSRKLMPWHSWSPSHPKKELGSLLVSSDVLADNVTDSWNTFFILQRFTALESYNLKNSWLVQRAAQIFKEDFCAMVSVTWQLQGSLGLQVSP